MHISKVCTLKSKKCVNSYWHLYLCVCVCVCVCVREREREREKERERQGVTQKFYLQYLGKKTTFLHMNKTCCGKI
jgi:hypothetical protein